MGKFMGLPPIEFDDVFIVEAIVAQQISVPQRCHDYRRARPCCEMAQTLFVAVIIVIVGKEDDVDIRQIL